MTPNKNTRQNTMSKRRIDEEESDIDISSTESEASDNEQDQEEESEIIDIDFDFFDVDKEVDFHAVKNLLRQLIGEDSKQLQLSPLADHVLDSLCTTIKTDGKESDPYAFLAPLNLKEIKTNDYVKYIHRSNPSLSSFLNKISNKRVSLLLSERLINMPIQVIPATYKIVLEEIEKAGEKYDYYLIPSRKYEVNEESEENSNKRVKTVDVDYYHHEDKFLEDNAKFKIQLPSKRGILQTFIVIDHEGLITAIGELEEAIATAF